MTLTPSDWSQWFTTPGSDVFGSLVDGWALKQGLVGTLKEWLPTYVGEFNRQVGAEALTAPFDYAHKPSDRLPAGARTCAVNTAIMGTKGPPKRHGDGVLWATYSVRVYSYLYGTADWNESEALLYAYAAITRSAILQQPSLGVGASSTLWTGTQFFENKGLSSPLIAAYFAEVNFDVSLPNVGDVLGGVASPSVGPPAPLPDVQTTGVIVTDEPL